VQTIGLRSKYTKAEVNTRDPQIAIAETVPLKKQPIDN